MLVCGLDLSLTSTGLALSTGETMTILSNSKTATFHRFRFILERILGVVEVHNAGLVVVEGLALSSRTGQALTRAGLWHFVMERIDSIGVEWAEVAPTTLKKYGPGKGNASKEDVLLAVVRRFPEVPLSNNNEADAWTLMAMGRDYIGQPMTEMPAINRTALKAVSWPGRLVLSLGRAE